MTPNEVLQLTCRLGSIVKTIGNYVRRLDDLEHEVETAHELLSGQDELDPNIQRARESLAHIEGFLAAREKWGRRN